MKKSYAVRKAREIALNIVKNHGDEDRFRNWEGEWSGEFEEDLRMLGFSGQKGWFRALILIQVIKLWWSQEKGKKTYAEQDKTLFCTCSSMLPCYAPNFILKIVCDDLAYMCMGLGLKDRPYLKRIYREYGRDCRGDYEVDWVKLREYARFTWDSSADLIGPC